MVGLYSDPEGKSIFEKTSAASNLSTGIMKESGSKFNESETLALRRRIRELEDKVEVRMYVLCKNQQLNYVTELIFEETLQQAKNKECELSLPPSLPVYNPPYNFKYRHEIKSPVNKTWRPLLHPSHLSYLLLCHAKLLPFCQKLTEDKESQERPSLKDSEEVEKIDDIKQGALISEKTIWATSEERK